jgi:hypothetical protein
MVSLALKGTIATVHTIGWREMLMASDARNSRAARAASCR